LTTNVSGKVLDKLIPIKISKEQKNLNQRQYQKVLLLILN